MNDVIRWHEWGKGFNPAAIGMHCNIEQYHMLKRCSDEKDIAEWNEWREANPDEEIWLCGADLAGADGKGADLQGGNATANLIGVEPHAAAHAHAPTTNSAITRTNSELLAPQSSHLERKRYWNRRISAHRANVHLEGAVLEGAELELANLRGAHLEGANLTVAHIEIALLQSAHLTGSQLIGAHLEGAILEEAHLEDARLDGAILQKAILHNAILQGAHLTGVHIEGANLLEAHLEGADFEAAAVDGDTMLWHCPADKNTYFTGVGLDAARVEPGLKQLLKDNVREKRWKEWYTNCRWRDKPLVPLVWFFWLFSGYGRSTKRIIGWFFGLALAFGGVYHIGPSLVETNHGVGAITNFWHAFYFSVVTMTTLGFGDIHANPDSWLGQTVLMAQVILGYVLLGALVTRFAILFSGEGPAASPTPPPKEPDEDD